MKMAMMMIMMPFCASCKNGIPISPFFFVPLLVEEFSCRGSSHRPRRQFTGETTRANTMSMNDGMILVQAIEQ